MKSFIEIPIEALPANSTRDYARTVEQAGTIEEIRVWFPAGSGTDLLVNPTIDQSVMVNEDEAPFSTNMADGIIGSNVVRSFDVSIPVSNGTDIGVMVENRASSGSDLAGAVTFVVDYRGGMDRAPDDVQVVGIGQRLGSWLSDLVGGGPPDHAEGEGNGGGDQ